MTDDDRRLLAIVLRYIISILHYLSPKQANRYDPYQDIDSKLSRWGYHDTD